MELLDALQQMLRARRFEEGLLALRESGEMKVHFHTSIGQEAVAVAAMQAANLDDVIFTNHRSNSHLVARGMALEVMYAEQLGRLGGVTRGKGGTLHMVAPDLGIPWTSSLLGGSVPIAVGVAYAMKGLDKRGVVIAFFGDGAMEEGAFYEALNLASIWRVPLVLICENNDVPEDQVGLETACSHTLGVDRLAAIPQLFGIGATVIDGTDYVQVASTLTTVVKSVRTDGLPRFVEVRTTRYPGNRGFWPELASERTNLRWATTDIEPPGELSGWCGVSDPILNLVRHLVTVGGIALAQIEEVDRAVDSEILAAVESALESPAPPMSSAYSDVFAPSQETS